MPTLKLYVLGNLIDSMPISFKGLTDKEEREEHLNGMIQWLKNNNSACLVVHPYEILLDEVESKACNLIKQDNVNDDVIKTLYKRTIAKKPFKNIDRPVKKIIADAKYEAPDVKQPFVRPKAEYSNMRLYDLV